MSFLKPCGNRETAERIRFLRRLAAPGSKLVLLRASDAATPKSGDHSAWVFERNGRQDRTAVPQLLVRAALAEGVAGKTGGTEIRISQAGRLALKRALSAGDEHAIQHRIPSRPGPATIPAAGGAGADRPSPETEPVVRNLAESPLARLATRKTKNGRPLLSREEFSAGERLRADYSFAAMMPSIGLGWRTERTGAGPGCGSADLSDDVMAARQRVERVLGSLEPVLAGVLVDVCCHLKGLETVEAERGWPARCAKIVLQIGLSALADRYGERTQGADGGGKIRNWSTG